MATAANNMDMRSIYVSNIPESITAGTIREHFQQYGRIQKLTMNRTPNRSVNYAIIAYTNLDEAHTALLSLTHSINGYTLSVETKKKSARRGAQNAATNNASQETNNRIFINNLPPALTAAKLKPIFGVYGQITDAMVLIKPNGESKGCGFISFSTAEAAQRCLDLGSIVILNRTCQIKVARPRARARHDSLSSASSGIERHGRAVSQNRAGNNNHATNEAETARKIQLTLSSVSQMKKYLKDYADAMTLLSAVALTYSDMDPDTSNCVNTQNLAIKCEKLSEQITSTLTTVEDNVVFVQFAQPSNNETTQEIAAMRLKIDQMESDLEAGLCCPICANLYAQTVALACGHLFCKSCIEKWLLRNQHCPNCRAAQFNHAVTPIHAIDGLVRNFASLLL